MQTPLDDSQPTASTEALDDPLRDALPRAVPALRDFVRRLRVPRDQVEDVVQETLARVWRSRERFDAARGELGSWLRTTAFRSWLDLRERAARHAGESVEHEPSDPRAGHPGRGLELEELLAALRPLERDVLERFHRRGCSIREIAASLDLPENTVKSHLHRARRRLAERRRAEEEPR